MANHRQRLTIIALLHIAMLGLSGCQLTSHSIDNDLSFGEYYLALQQLSQQQLTNEIKKQQINAEGNTNDVVDYNAQIKLLLLYSLPKSPIYNSFHAKISLNQLKSEQHAAAFSSFTPSDQALISLLDDQLNQRLLMRNRLIDQQKEQQEHLQKSALKIQQGLIEQIKSLEQTIKQLKDIEQAIDKRDQ